MKFISRLLHRKSRNQCSDKAFDELLLLLGDVFSEGHKLPSNYYAVKKIVKKLSLGYEKKFMHVRMIVCCFMVMIRIWDNMGISKEVCFLLLKEFG